MDIFSCRLGETRTIFAKRMKEARVARNKTLDDVAKHCAVSRGSIIGWENGSQIPSLRKFEIWCKFVDVSADYILREEN